MSIDTQAADAEINEAPAADADHAAREVPDALVTDELLVEEVSIDGMCGVY